MGELRKDSLLDRWVIIAPKREQRPQEFVAPSAKAIANCFFCPGSEHLTPQEIGRIPNGNTWSLRWFDNKFAAVVPDGNPEIHEDRFFTHADAVGHHEIIVETPSHRQLAELSEHEIEQVLQVYKARINEMKKDGYVTVIKNSGVNSGASLIHSHSQVLTTQRVPHQVHEKVLARRKFVSCPHCDIIKAEAKSERLCFANEHWVAFCPYASRFNYECAIYPIDHRTSLNDIPLHSLASILKRVLTKLATINASYNFALTYSPEGEDLHFHIEVMPRIAIWGGFELSTGICINSIAPEDAAKFYRGEQ